MEKITENYFTDKITLSRRLGSMLMDFFILCAIAAIAGIPCSILASLLVFPELRWVTAPVIFVIGLNKDFFRGKSIAKRAYGFVVLDKSGGPASRLQCFIRNLTFMIYPVEVIFSLFSRQRRLGDLIAGTKIEKSGKEVIAYIADEIRTYLRMNKNA